MWDNLLDKIIAGDFKSIARAVSLVENESEGYIEFLESLPPGNAPVIGITGPPGAGKSSLTDRLISELIKQGSRVAVICIDPTSSFHSGALLGDRIRMSSHYNDPAVYIRSLASRGSLGGLHANIIEITDVLRAAGFDYIIIETVGVGQNEIDIVSMADITIVAIVPESGDDIQAMKSGIMEIADIFVVNKADRPGADTFISHLRAMLSPAFSNHKNEVLILKTSALNNEGISELCSAIQNNPALLNRSNNSKLLAEKAYRLIMKEKMKAYDLSDIEEAISKQINNDNAQRFNLYRFIKTFTPGTNSTQALS